MNLKDTLRPNRRRNRRLAAASLAVGALVLGFAATSSALVQPGTPGKDVTFGTDTDNADNTFIQPAGVTAKQHMDNTDVLFGRANDDLLVGNLGGDTLLGGTGSDILVGGPEKFATPNSDVLIGDWGNDINIWAPGDGSDAFTRRPGLRHDDLRAVRERRRKAAHHLEPTAARCRASTSTTRPRSAAPSSRCRRRRGSASSSSCGSTSTAPRS